LTLEALGELDKAGSTKHSRARRGCPGRGGSGRVRAAGR
jgi:hypothetical protein